MIYSNELLFIRNPGVRGGGLLPALHPSSQPYQPGGDQRQAGVHESGGAGSKGTFEQNLELDVLLFDSCSMCVIVCFLTVGDKLQMTMEFPQLVYLWLYFSLNCINIVQKKGKFVFG